MHQNAFGGRVPPGPTGEAYSASPDPLYSWILGVVTSDRERRGREGRSGRERRRGKETEGKEERGKVKGRRDGTTPNKKAAWLRACKASLE